MDTILSKNASALDLLNFIERSPSCFHAVENLCSDFIDSGFTRLEECNEWNLTAGGKYFVTRNNSSIIAFCIPKSGEYKGFSMVASHSDSPSFKIKENEEIESEKRYIKLNVEKYGGMLCAPWFDRPLSVAGRVICRGKGSSSKVVVEQHLVNVDRDLLMIPNLAIHMNRDANDGFKYNVQHDLLPVFSFSGDGAHAGRNNSGSFMKIVAQAAGVEVEDILSSDLFLYNRVKGTFWGAENEFIASSRLDDLECAWTTGRAFLNACSAEVTTECVPVYCVFDNEEVGSQTRQGAASTFLADTLQRINSACGKSLQQYHASIANSFMVSADNAHAVHPNYCDKADPVNRPFVNGGPVIKFNAAQKYTSDGISASIFKQVCKNAGVPYQIFTNRSDMAGGSTLGNISGTQVSVNAVDIGLAQWAMHSPYESAGSLDPDMMIKAVEQFYLTDREVL